MNERRVMVTGANGFLGRAFCAHALACGFMVRGATRSPASLPKEIENVVIGSVDHRTNWHDALVRCDSVVHLAARVHVMNEDSCDPLAEFRHVNVEGTLNLARRAAEVGVRRFIFVSSIGVNGEAIFGKRFSATDEPLPKTPYAVSKHEAELGLKELSRKTDMEIVVVRPPMVYGPNAPGNFASLIKWVSSGIPLPLGSVTDNRRSFVFLDNLIDMIIKCIDHPAAANQTFLVSDGEDLSTAVLLRRVGAALGRPTRLIPVPVELLTRGASLLGCSGIAQRLCGSLEIDITKTMELLGWSPPVSVDEGLRRTAECWLKADVVRHS